MIEYTKQTIMQWTRMGSRKTFGYAMNELNFHGSNLFVMTADLATSANLQDFAKNFPEQFADIGIAEINMAAMAAGMAKEGYNVFITSFAPFVSMRAFEAARTLIAYMKLNVKIVALASGVSMESHGNTHYGLEDLALMRTIPGMLVLSPADSVETVKCVEALMKYNGPAYLRLSGVPGSGNVYKDDYDFELGKSVVIRNGKDIAIIATGSMVFESIRAARGLERYGISACIINMHTIKPLDYAILNSLIEDYDMVITVEEHTMIGGLGSSVSEYYSAKEKHPKVLSIGISDQFPIAGDYQYVLDQCGLTGKKIMNTVLEAYKQ